MKGVEILNEIQVVAQVAFSWTAFWIVCGTIVGISIIAGIILSITYYADLASWKSVISVGIILGLIFGVIFGVMFETPTKYETHYQVIIDDSVSMNDFLDKYEIIDTEGKIFTVRERD